MSTISDTEKPHLFYNESPCCKTILRLIDQQSANNNYIYHDVTNPEVFNRLPASFTTVPILIVKGIKTPLLGKEVYNWIETQKYINLTTNNINKLSDPEFYVDPTIGKTEAGNFSAIRDQDDKKMAPDVLYCEDFDKEYVTGNMKKRYIDKRINSELQKQKMESLLTSRNEDLNAILNANKEF